MFHQGGGPGPGLGFCSWPPAVVPWGWVQAESGQGQGQGQGIRGTHWGLGKSQLPLPHSRGTERKGLRDYCTQDAVNSHYGLDCKGQNMSSRSQAFAEGGTTWPLSGKLSIKHVVSSRFLVWVLKGWAVSEACLAFPYDARGDTLLLSELLHCYVQCLDKMQLDCHWVKRLLEGTIFGYLLSQSCIKGLWFNNHKSAGSRKLR